MNPCLRPALLLLSLAAFAQASGVTLGPATGYNVFTFSDFTPTGSDTLGKVAVGGNFTGNGYLVGSALKDSASTLDFIVNGNLSNSYFTGTGGGTYVGGNATLYGASLGNLYVGGNLSTQNGSLTTAAVAVNGNINAGSGGFSNSGNIYTKGKFNASYASGTVYSASGYEGPSWVNHAAYGSASDPLTVPTSPLDFSAAQTALGTATNGLSNLLANTAQNGTVTTDSTGGMTFTGTDTAQVVVNVTASQLSYALRGGSTGLTINAPSSATVVINVTGSDAVAISGSSMAVLGPSASQILFNFPATQTISFNNFGMTASVLAPNATFNGLGGQFNGELIANKVTGVTEFHNDNVFGGSFTVSSGGGSNQNLTAAPEPSTWVMLILAGLTMAWMLRKRTLNA